MSLRIVPVAEGSRELWRDIHDQIIPTAPLTSDDAGLDFALAQGFVEHDRYTLADDSTPFIDLHLTGWRSKASVSRSGG